MKNPVFILPISLCCLAASGQQQPADPTTQTNATQSAAQTNTAQSVTRTNAAGTNEVSPLEDPMLAKYKKNPAWIKLTAAIEKKTPICTSLGSQITKLGKAISAKLDAKEDATPQILELQRLRQSRSTMLREIETLKKSREATEAEIRRRAEEER
jgi:hypothetical protein